jgi:hypothetical protein
MLASQASFTAGELSPSLRARVDMAKYTTGAARLENLITLPQGGVTRRPGFAPVHDLGAGGARLVPFVYNAEDTLLLAFDGTPTITALFYDRPPVTFQAAPTAPVYQQRLSRLRWAQSGNVMFFAHPDYPPAILRRNSLTDWVFSRLEPRDGPWETGSGKGGSGEFLHVESGSPWRFWGSPERFGALRPGDMIRVDVTIGGEVSGWVPAYTQGYVSAPVIVYGQWELTTAGRNWGAKIFIEKSLDAGASWFVIKTREKANEEDGNNFIISGAEDEPDVIYRVRVDMNPGDGASLWYSLVAAPFVKSLSFRVTTIPTSSTHPVTGAPAVRFLGVLLTDTRFVGYDVSADAIDWALGAWDDGNGWPGAVAFYQNRLVYAGSRAEPQNVWMSRVGDYWNFSISDPLRDDDAITMTLAGDGNDEIHSLVSMSDLLAFTGAGEWKIAGSGDSGAISPKAVVAHQQTRIGSAPIQPVVVGGGAVFVQRQGGAVHALGYSLQSDSYAGSDISILSSHIFEGREIVDMAYQQVPDSILWLALADGTMAACTYNPDHEIAAWGRHERPGETKILSLAAVPSIARERGTDLYAVEERGGEFLVSRMGSRVVGDVPPDGRGVLETLSLNAPDSLSSTIARKKLISRVFLYVLGTRELIVSPAGPGFPDDGTREKVTAIPSAPGMMEIEAMIDGGFARGAALRVASSGEEPLTLLAVAPVLTMGDW